MYLINKYISLLKHVIQFLFRLVLFCLIGYCILFYYLYYISIFCMDIFPIIAHHPPFFKINFKGKLEID